MHTVLVLRGQTQNIAHSRRHMWNGRDAFKEAVHEDMTIDFGCDTNEYDS